MSKSAVEDISLDTHPGKLRPPEPPKRTWTWEQLRDLGKRLSDATEQMNEALCRIEDIILERLGEDARGRVELQRGEAPIRGKKGKVVGKRPWVEFLIYRDGEMFVESNRGDSSRFTLTHMLSTSRETRTLICGKVAELWEACGGKLPPHKDAGVER